MPAISYHTIGGRIVAQTSPVQREEFLPDALGSVVRTTHNGGSGGRTLRYGPYGSTLYDDNSWDNPRWRWNGQ